MMYKYLLRCPYTPICRAQFKVLEATELGMVFTWVLRENAVLFYFMEMRIYCYTAAWAAQGSGPLSAPSCPRKSNLYPCSLQLAQYFNLCSGKSHWCHTAPKKQALLSTKSSCDISAAQKNAPNMTEFESTFESTLE